MKSDHSRVNCYRVPLRPFFLTALAGVLPIFFSGCQAARMKTSHYQLRRLLMDYTEDQILDNLIRAKNHRPIVHFDVVDFNAAVKTTVGGKFGGGQTLKNTGLVTEATRPLTLEISPSAENNLHVSMKPLLDKNEVYAAYEKFVAEADSIIEGRPEKLPASKLAELEGVHVGKIWEDGKYYWVPKKYKEAYFQLALATAVKRGQTGGSTANTTTTTRSPKEPRVKSLMQQLKTPDVSPSLPKSSEAEDLERAARQLRQLRFE
jgi:hypothetical protein